MPEDFVMPPDPHSGGGLDFGGFNQTGPLNLTYLTKPKQKQVVPYDQRLEEYTAGGGKKATNPWQRGGRAGFLGGFAGDMGFFETISDILPYDPGKEWFKGIGDALEEEAYEVPMRTLRDIKGAGDFMDYMGQGIGYVFGYVGSMIPTALATGGLGAAGRIVGREALKGLTKKQIGARGAQAVGRFVTGPSIIKNTGHIYRGVREETGVESPAIAIPAGIASGMLERFGMGKTFGTFFETIPFNAKQQVWRQMVANAMRGYGRAWAIEGATETGQELIQLAANEVADSTYDLVTSENAWRVLDAAALGAFGSGPFGAIGSAGNYYGQKVSAEKDKKLVDEVIRRVQNIAPEGSQIMFRMGQQRIKEQAALLGDEEFIPTDSHVETLERVVDQIQEQKSLSEEQKAALLADATNVLGRFRERFATQEATKAEESSDVEVAARDNREAAEQVAGVPSQQMVEPESAILPENQAPYNNPESRYNIGQEYKHRLDTVEGEAIQVDAVVTKIGKDGRVLESVSADENRLPLIVTKGKKTISLHTQEDVLNVMKELDADKFGRPEPKSAAESSLAMVQLLDAQEKRKVSREVAEEAGAEIETDEIIPATELIKRRKAREASVAAKKAGKPPLQAAKAVAKAVRTVYAAKPAPTAKVGREEMDRINLENKRKTILKSKVVEVSRPGEKRRTGVITEVKLLQHFSEAVGGPRMFSAEVHWDDGEIETVSIDENFESSQPLYGGLMVVAKNGKLSKEQESAISNVEKKVIPAVDPEAEEVAEVQVPPPTEKPRATKETTKAPTKPQPTKEVEVTKRIVKGEKPEVKPEEVAGLSSEETLLLKAINTEVTKRTIGVRDTGAGAVTTVDEATGELLLDGLSEAEIKGEQYQLANRGMRVDAVKMLVENTGWLFDARRQELGLTKIAAENIKIIEALKKKVGEQKPVILGNLKLDKDLSARMRQMRNDRAEEDKMQMTIETFIVRSFVELGRLIETATIYIRQLYRNGKVKSGEKFNRETRGYKAVRDRFIKDLSIDLEERLPQDALMPHLPSFGEDPVKFLGGLFDAVVEEYNKVDGVRGLSSMEDGGVNQDKARELEGLILDKDTLSKYLDYPIAEDTDDERTIVIANSNIFKKTDTGWDINNIELYSDDLSKQYIPVMDFSDHKGLSVTIKSVGKGMDAIAYRLSEEALKRVRFQESKTSGREGKVTFAHIPESLLIENGNVQYDNWVLDTQKAGGRFLKDISWVGLPTEEFVRLLKLRTKNKELKAFLKSKKGGLLLSSKEEVAATIANAILLASDPRYKPSNKKAKTAKKALAEKKDSKVALFSVDQLQKLLEHAINIHLDHFATLTEKQLGLLTPELTELNRLTAYHNKLFRAYHEKSIPRALDLPKLDANLEPESFVPLIVSSPPPYILRVSSSKYLSGIWLRKLSDLSTKASPNLALFSCSNWAISSEPLERPISTEPLPPDVSPSASLPSSGIGLISRSIDLRSAFTEEYPKGSVIVIVVDRFLFGIMSRLLLLISLLNKILGSALIASICRVILSSSVLAA